MTQEWAENLSNELRSWLPQHGYKAGNQLAKELDIPVTSWGSIFRGKNIAVTGIKDKFDGRIFYARLNLWTELDAADPRTIPDRLIRIPNGDLIPQRRGWTQEEYRQWIESPEAKDLLTRKIAHFNREIGMESETILQIAQPSETTSKQAETPETMGSFVGSFIDGLVSRGSNQIARALIESQDEVLLPRISILEEKVAALEGIFTRLAIHLQADQTSSPRRQRGSNDIGKLANHLKDLLDGYKHGTSEDRNKLMGTYGRDLMALDMVVHTLTRRAPEREEMLKLGEKTNL